MKRELKAFLVTGLIVVFAITLFSGCGGNAADNTAQGGTAQASTAQSTQKVDNQQPEPNALPITTQPVKLTYWCDLGKAAGAVKTLAENLALQELQKRTGITIEFLHPPVGSSEEQFNLLIASGKYPDLIEYDWTLVPGGPGALLADNVIIPLNEPVKKWAPNLIKAYQDFPLLRKQQELDDGTYYVFPSVYGSDEMRHSGGPIVRMDWLKKLNLEMPTTIDEWTQMLRAAKGKDLNGNGKNDEIPFFFAGRLELTDVPLILDAFGVTNGFLQDKGKVYYSPIAPAYKDFLQTMNTWYKEGLMDPESLAANAKIKDEKVVGNRVLAMPGFMGNSITRYTKLMKDTTPGFQLMPMPYPTLKKGDAPILSQLENMYFGCGVVITSACKNVKEAVKLLDYGYSDEGHELMCFGVEGKTYTMVNGTATYTDLILKNPDGLSKEQALAKYTYWQSMAPCFKTTDVLNQRDSLPEQIEGRKNWMNVKNEVLLPPVNASVDESKELANIMTDIDTYAAEMFNQFISGKAPLSDFDSYVSRIKEMGIDKAVELTQKQLDRYSSRP